LRFSGCFTFCIQYGHSRHPEIHHHYWLVGPYGNQWAHFSEALSPWLKCLDYSVRCS